MKISICLTLKDLPDWHTNWISLIIRGHSSLSFLFPQGEKNLKKAIWPNTFKNPCSGARWPSLARPGQSVRKLTLNGASLKTLEQASSEGTSRCWMSAYIPQRGSALFLKVSWKKTLPWIKPKLEQDFGPMARKFKTILLHIPPVFTSGLTSEYSPFPAPSGLLEAEPQE